MCVLGGCGLGPTARGGGHRPSCVAREVTGVVEHGGKSLGEVKLDVRPHGEELVNHERQSRQAEALPPNDGDAAGQRRSHHRQQDGVLGDGDEVVEPWQRHGAEVAEQQVDGREVDDLQVDLDHGLVLGVGRSSQLRAHPGRHLQREERLSGTAPFDDLEAQLLRGLDPESVLAGERDVRGLVGGNGNDDAPDTGVVRGHLWDDRREVGRVQADAKGRGEVIGRKLD
mmetsp:Transcript_33391/g.66273  ORF Transcript_33391/g.66273 Transcript_33391/m.66273 type:complete len:227 (+) Transcript_33391:101-781(+)